MEVSYLGILFLMIVSPIPPEVFMPLAGMMVAQNKLNFLYVVLAGVLGFLVSALPWYLAGKYLGRDGLRRYFNRSNRWIKIKLPVKKLARVNRWFQRYDKQALLFAFLLPGVRNLVSVPAGMSGMSLPLYLSYTSAGAILWLTALTYAGYVLGDRFHLVEQYVISASPLVITCMGAGAIAWFTRRHWKRWIRI